MKRMIYIVLSLAMITMLPSCGKIKAEKEAAIRARIEKEFQDSIQQAKDSAEAQRKAFIAEQERKQREFENSQVGQAWNFVKNQLRSPSTARLHSYTDMTHTDCQIIARKLHLPAVILLWYDAQNGFGATLRENTIVLFNSDGPYAAHKAQQYYSLLE